MNTKGCLLEWKKPFVLVLLCFTWNGLTDHTACDCLNTAA